MLAKANPSSNHPLQVCRTWDHCNHVEPRGPIIRGQWTRQLLLGAVEEPLWPELSKCQATNSVHDNHLDLSKSCSQDGKCKMSIGETIWNLVSTSRPTNWHKRHMKFVHWTLKQAWPQTFLSIWSRKRTKCQTSEKSLPCSWQVSTPWQFSSVVNLSSFITSFLTSAAKMAPCHSPGC